jgi:hypothetical protein
MVYFSIPAATGGFFFSAFLLMIFWGIIAPDFGIDTIGYKIAMLMTIALWLVVAPLAAAVARKRFWK